ncbi:F-box domain-containing protein [Pandoravirus kuranda]|uniref:F-box domain-containing protein n=2 Tax=Pandoravirus TaxID=2060084 RepID=A0AA95EBW3_9VIRU|nr:Morn repeat domain containing protein [Pandoravirus neocaledonia]AVK75664.1 Morn repeat domain containing protein [Pandoravirus neocaledonia]WBR14226.1 F-box domain-containing protein [Pandoravirus kuranda]
MPAGLVDLPDEVLLTVLAYGGAGVVVRLAQTCRRLSTLCDDDALWRDLCALHHGSADAVCFAPNPWRGWPWVYRARESIVVAGEGTSLGCARATPARRYAGEWVDGEPHGYGRSDECTYWGMVSHQGWWHQGRPHGFGIRRVDGVETYRGDYRHGREHGVGRVLGNLGWTYEGEIADGQPHGLGVFCYADGGRHRGHFHHGRCHGPGTLVRPDGTTTTGCWDGERVALAGTEDATQMVRAPTVDADLGERKRTITRPWFAPTSTKAQRT